MKEYQDRVVKEKKELDDKIAKLKTFLYGETVKGVEEAEQVRMWTQYHLMCRYAKVLGERIAAFE